MIGYAFTGSFCTLSRSLDGLRALKATGADIVPFVSERVYSTDTRFFAARDFCAEVEGICARPVIHTVEGAEPYGPTRLEYLVIAPCTGNTLAKIANGITDTAVTMAAKAHLRCDGRLLIALASNDALSQNLKNIAALISRKSVYLLPMRQDAPEQKPHSLVAEFSKLSEGIAAMKRGDQLRPLFL